MMHMVLSLFFSSSKSNIFFIGRCLFDLFGLGGGLSVVDFLPAELFDNLTSSLTIAHLGNDFFFASIHFKRRGHVM